MLLATLFASTTATAAETRREHLTTYRQQGIDQADPRRGKQLWFSSKNARSCTTCHGNNIADTGKHPETGKTIEPMALSVNAARYQSAKKIEKWFLRNCKWTFGRECSTQEKADILTWLASQ